MGNKDIKKEITLEDCLEFDMFCDFVQTKNKYKSDMYCHKNHIGRHYFKIDADECAIFVKDGTVYAVIDGSDVDLKEWMGNFDLRKGLFGKKEEGQKGYHYNYYGVAVKFLDYVRNYVDSFLKLPRAPIIFLGRSRGTIVDIAHKELLKDPTSKHKIMCVTEDGPRTTKKSKLKKYFSTLKKPYIYHRMVAGQTFVSRVPLRLFGWRHSESNLIKLPKVKGKMDHTHLREAILKAIEIRDRNNDG